MQEGTVSVASVAMKQGKSFILLSFSCGLPYCSIQKYSINVLKNMNNDVCKTHMYQGDTTNISENEHCKNIPHSLETNAAIRLFFLLVYLGLEKEDFLRYS